jgi:hypothetical protein
MGAVMLAWIVEVGIITWRDLTGKSPNHTVAGLPLPADYLATFLIFGVLGFVPKSNAGASRTAGLVAWAYVVATYMNVAPQMINPTKTTNASTSKGSVTTSKTAPSSTTGSAIIP